MGTSFKKKRNKNAKKHEGKKYPKKMEKNR